MPEPLITLRSGYQLNVFADQDAVRSDEVAELWVREGVLPAAEAERRVSELLLVATSPDGQLGGVSTAFLQHSEQLRTDMWFGRMFVATAHRLAGIMMGLAFASRDYLEARFTTGLDRRAIGMVFEVENAILKTGHSGPIGRYGPLAEWPTDFTFIGENEREDHVRVHYFAGAHAPEPQ